MVLKNIYPYLMGYGQKALPTRFNSIDHLVFGTNYRNPNIEYRDPKAFSSEEDFEF